MLDPITIATLANAAKSIRNLAKDNGSTNQQRVEKFIKFCDNIISIINNALDELKKDAPEELVLIGAQLRAWAASDKFTEPTLKVQRDKFCQALGEIASQMISIDASRLDSQNRVEMKKQLLIILGDLKGLSSVLRFENQLPLASTMADATGDSTWKRWADLAIAPAAGAAVADALANAAEYVPIVGPAIAEYMPSVGSTIAEYMPSMGSTIAENMSSMSSAIAENMSSMGSAIAGNVSSIGSDIAENMSSMSSTIAEYMPSIASTIAEYGPSVGSTILGWISYSQKDEDVGDAS